MERWPKFKALLNNPPKLEVKEGATEIIITTISAMCDNEGTIRFKKNRDDNFDMSGMGFSLSNWQFKHPIHDIAWAADDESWDEVFAMINSGTARIEKIKSR